MAKNRYLNTKFWDDNYISLLPGEKKTISAQFAKVDLNGENPVFRYQGINVSESSPQPDK